MISTETPKHRVDCPGCSHYEKRIETLEDLYITAQKVNLQALKVVQELEGPMKRAGIPKTDGYYGYNISPIGCDPTWEIVSVFNGLISYMGRVYDFKENIINTQPEDWTEKIEIQWPT